MLRAFGVPLGATIEVTFLDVYVWWARGGGPPRLTHAARRAAFRSGALVGMVPIVFGAGVLLGLIARSSRSLVPCMIGHVVMDVGLFAYWWTGIAGDFTARPISETGVDPAFLATCAATATFLLVVLHSVQQLRRIRGVAPPMPPSLTSPDRGESF